MGSYPHLHPQQGAEESQRPMHMHNKVHGHASLIKMYATHMCNGWTTYKMQWGWCIRGPKPVRFPRFPAPQTEGTVYTEALT
ncbi:hypothetical protein EVAR_100612_1 [Eumeta japonica]|uniref:Uncharacterized protein n=1 Tax=Eumeta variegata TaxID=151549 RepID=A0A4C1ZCG5_EUMVA|nr:hypothetical protein EVAR_100612_1 [Eumeta japonica]